MALPLDFYDAELRRHNEHFRAGQPTRQAARAAVDGSALGADPSAPMLERARRLSDDEGLRNVSYQQGDTETHPFPPAHFDLCISRFGTMFFADPIAAFANIGRALRHLRATLAAHHSDDGVLFDSRAWIVTAVTPEGA